MIICVISNKNFDEFFFCMYIIKVGKKGGIYDFV